MVFKSSQNDSKEIIIYGSTIIIDISAENNPEINHTLTGVVDNIAKGFYKDFIQNSKSNFSLQRRIVLACSRLVLNHYLPIVMNILNPLCFVDYLKI